MPSFDIVKEVDVKGTFRVKSVMGAFDITAEKITERFTGDIDLDNKEWNVGLIVGGSGTGKSTIAKELFSEYLFDGYDYSKGSVIDDMPEGAGIKEIQHVFTSVGFASPPSWLKPYSVLSNGEKMRVDLARGILENRDIIAFDEFTSVVNREVAKTGSYAISKAVRRMNKKFVAIACHKDIIDWLEPDWIYDTDKKEYHFFQKGGEEDRLSNLKYTRLRENSGIEFGKHLGNIII